ncbi:nuclear transport factor 2 family protein [Aestuariirhabdus litorea]|uniref:Nuclear transport factor 2 family protein n=1 Tax=Aestuariirhabdus litorea TaxID=2528527 RepID=A0A3P3VNB5_9GAMM|nr:nuclear transport factor 2 family protein [Aestuariirhabdus litorea]RRJ83837.1 nuclear transport factor 2 family protein [Aestuariirhabdus litorea]RWW97060.1 nuclear transport factor 2 family protein [Endozoicomonadaceae bacterium GTF-13]
MNPPIIQRFKDYYSDFDQQSVESLGELYAVDMHFRDPLHQLDGLEAVQLYFEELSRDLTHCRFEFLHEMVNASCAYFHWTMHYAHPRIKGGQALSLNGVTHIRFDDRVLFHEDFYDMGAMLYQHLPLLGWAVRSLNQRLLRGSTRP